MPIRPMEVGDAVEIHSAFEDTWSRGFEIAAVVEGGFAVRRLFDGCLLPVPTGMADVRPAQDGPWSHAPRMT